MLTSLFVAAALATTPVSLQSIHDVKCEGYTLQYVAQRTPNETGSLDITAVGLFGLVNYYEGRAEVELPNPDARKHILETLDYSDDKADLAVRVIQCIKDADNLMDTITQ